MRDIPRIVKNLVKKYGTRDPFALAKYKGIDIIERSLPCNINGVFAYFRRYKIIILNTDLDNLMKKIVAAHELGHYILHRDINHIFLKQNTYYNSSKYESQADIFVAELFIPDDYSMEDMEAAYEQTAVAEEIADYFWELKRGNS